MMDWRSLLSYVPRMQFNVKGSKSMGAVARGPYETSAALRKAVEMRDDGYSNIRLVLLPSGQEFDIEQFMRAYPDA